jgi:16S rRNA (cytidine1402-2'-O)-methyltransferase
LEIQTKPLDPGLYFVATPIGTARDITLRALDILASADVIAAEDTRTAKHLMQIHGITLGERPMIAYHDHSAPALRDKIVAMIAGGKSVAYASEAGTPLVADPGFQLARAVIAAGLPVTTAPGPSAVLAALTVSGLPSDRFLFAGFPPTAKGQRAKMLAELARIPATLVLYESPKRVHRLLGELGEHFGKERQAVVCRELTKRFEEVARGSLAELEQAFADRAVKGEVVVLVDRAPAPVADAQSLEAALRAALPGRSVKDAAAEVAAALNLPRRQVYQEALKLAGED